MGDSCGNERGSNLLIVHTLKVCSIFTRQQCNENLEISKVFTK